MKAVGCGGTTSKQVTITVNQAPPPPPAPSKYVCGMTIYHKEGNNFVKNFTLNRSSPDVLFSGSYKDDQKASASFVVWGTTARAEVLWGNKSPQCEFDYDSTDYKGTDLLIEGNLASVSRGCGIVGNWRIELKMCNR
jgi:hypothetical protein